MLNTKIVSLCVMTNLNGSILRESSWKPPAHEMHKSHIYIFPSKEKYIESLSYVDEVNIDIKQEKECNSKVKFSWLKEQNEYSTKEIVMSLVKKLETNCKWKISKLKTAYDKTGIKVLRYKLYKVMSMKYCEKKHVLKIHEKAIKIAKKSKEVGHLMKDCKHIFHHYSIAVLGMDRLESTGFGFTSKDNIWYSVKYKQDESKKLYFSDLYIVDKDTMTSVEICPSTMIKKCLYKFNDDGCWKMSLSGKIISRTYGNVKNKFPKEIYDFITIQEFGSIKTHDVMYFGYKPHGTTIEFKINGLSRNHGDYDDTIINELSA